MLLGLHHVRRHTSTRRTHLMTSVMSSSRVHSDPPFCFQLRKLSHLVRHCFSLRVRTWSATCDHDNPVVMLSPGNVTTARSETFYQVRVFSADTSMDWTLEVPKRE